MNKMLIISSASAMVITLNFALVKLRHFIPEECSHCTCTGWLQRSPITAIGDDLYLLSLCMRARDNKLLRPFSYVYVRAQAKIDFIPFEQSDSLQQIMIEVADLAQTMD